MKRLCTAVIVDNYRVADGIHLMRLKEPFLSGSARAGQFVEIQVPGCNLLWRRPFSVHDVDVKQQTVDILYQTVGRGTAAMTKLKPGEELSVLGPLGNGFSVTAGLRRALLIAGGLGAAPFMLLMRELQRAGTAATLLYGVGDQSKLCCIDRFREFGSVRVATMNGSVGRKGTVIDLLLDCLQEENDEAALFACGPMPMLRLLQEIAQSRNLSAQVSLETIMACGFGACVGCAVPMKKPVPGRKEYFLACKDGPVFNIDEIIIHE